jgi:hypothetical protein
LASGATGLEATAAGTEATARLGHARGTLAEAAAAGDRAGLGALLDPAFVFIDEAGRLHAGDDAAAALGAAAHDRARGTVRTYGALALVTTREPAADAEAVAIEVCADRDGWRALLVQENRIAAADAASGHPAPQARPTDAPPASCPNPCDFVPYEPRSEDERDLIASFQALERAVTRNDADEWVKHVADEFIVYRTRQHPTTKAGRADALRRQKAVNAETFVAAIERMELRMFGDAALMRADHRMPGDRRPPYRAARIWVRRGGMWQMAMSQQTTRAS